MLEGRRFEHVEINDPRLVRPFDPAEVAAELVGERVAAVERRGKYLIVRFDSGRALLIHLRMTGSLRHGDSGLGDDPHRRALVRLDNGSGVAYRDVRRFGTWLLLEPGELEPYLAARVGEEPLDARFTAARLGERLAKRRAPIKAALARPADARGPREHLRRRGALARADPSAAPGREPRPRRAPAAAQRDPRRRSRTASRGRARRSATTACRTAPSGAMQNEFKVYGRGGEPCDRCGTPIAKSRVGGRGTWFCPTCQQGAPQAARSSSSRPSRSRRRSSV